MGMSRRYRSESDRLLNTYTQGRVAHMRGVGGLQLNRWRRIFIMVSLPNLIVGVSIVAYWFRIMPNYPDLDTPVFRHRK